MRRVRASLRDRPDMHWRDVPLPRGDLVVSLGVLLLADGRGQLRRVRSRMRCGPDVLQRCVHIDQHGDQLRRLRRPLWRIDPDLLRRRLRGPQLQREQLRRVRSSLCFADATLRGRAMRRARGGQLVVRQRTRTGTGPLGRSVIEASIATSGASMVQSSS